MLTNCSLPAVEPVPDRVEKIAVEVAALLALTDGDEPVVALADEVEPPIRGSARPDVPGATPEPDQTR